MAVNLAKGDRIDKETVRLRRSMPRTRSPGPSVEGNRTRLCVQ